MLELKESHSSNNAFHGVGRNYGPMDVITPYGKMVATLRCSRRGTRLEDNIIYSGSIELVLYSATVFILLYCSSGMVSLVCGCSPRGPLAGKAINAVFHVSFSSEKHRL